MLLRNFFSNGEGLPGAKGQCARQQRTANQSNQAVNVGFHGVEGINQFVYEPCDASRLRFAGKISKSIQAKICPLDPTFGDEIIMCQNSREPLLLTTDPLTTLCDELAGILPGHVAGRHDCPHVERIALTRHDCVSPTE